LYVVELCRGSRQMRIITGKDINDRRAKFRFPIHRELRYKLLHDDAVVETGIGDTSNIGSGGVAFRTERTLEVDAVIELSISWPILLDETCPMRLIAFGRVLRSGAGMTACTIDKYEFRTQGRTLQAVPITRGNGML